MVYTLEHLINECAELPYTLRTARAKLPVGKKKKMLKEVWDALTAWIRDANERGKGAKIPNFAEFNFAEIRDRRTGDVLKRKLKFRILESFARTHGLPYKKPLVPLPFGPVEDINFTKIAIKFSTTLTKDIVFVGVRDLVKAMGKCFIRHPVVTMDFGFGNLVCRNRKINFAFSEAFQKKKQQAEDAALEQAEKTQVAPRIGDIFRQMDVNDSGALSASEFRNGVAEILKDTEHTISRSEIDSFMRFIDSDGNGTLQLNELFRVLGRCRSDSGQATVGNVSGFSVGRKLLDALYKVGSSASTVVAAAEANDVRATTPPPDSPFHKREPESSDIIVTTSPPTSAVVPAIESPGTAISAERMSAISSPVEDLRPEGAWDGAEHDKHAILRTNEFKEKVHREAYDRFLESMEKLVSQEADFAISSEQDRIRREQRELKTRMDYLEKQKQIQDHIRDQMGEARRQREHEMLHMRDAVPALPLDTPYSKSSNHIVRLPSHELKKGLARQMSQKQTEMSKEREDELRSDKFILSRLAQEEKKAQRERKEKKKVQVREYSESWRRDRDMKEMLRQRLREASRAPSLKHSKSSDCISPTLSNGANFSGHAPEFRDDISVGYDMR